jgi:ubiquitin-like protein Pup
MAHFVGRENQNRDVSRLIFGAASSDQDQKQKPKDSGSDGEEGAEGGPKKLAKKGEELKEEMDSLVDEIDAVLEENAEEFVKNYVQRGGE